MPHSVRVHGLLHCNSGHALLDAALKGIGIIQLPDYYVSDHLAQGELIELLPELRAPAEDLGPLSPQPPPLPQGAAAGGLSGGAAERSPSARAGAPRWLSSAE
jgi:DNA-binding transcriptional LysR family regulator